MTTDQVTTLSEQIHKNVLNTASFKNVFFSGGGHREHDICPSESCRWRWYGVHVSETQMSVMSGGQR